MAYALTQVFLMVLVPLVQVVAGLFMWMRPPQKIKRFYGYRTALSMKNEDTWAFAHRLCGRLWTAAGLTLLVLSAAAAVWALARGGDSLLAMEMILVCGQVVLLLLSIVPVEVAMRRTFDRKGRRRQPPKNTGG